MSEFAEIAKKTQLDTIELFMQAGKEAKEEMNKVQKKQLLLNKHLLLKQKYLNKFL